MDYVNTCVFGIKMDAILMCHVLEEVHSYRQEMLHMRRNSLLDRYHAERISTKISTGFYNCLYWVIDKLLVVRILHNTANTTYPLFRASVKSAFHSLTDMH